MGNGQVGPKSSKTVIIVGAGYVGTAVAKELDAKFKVTLIEPQDALTHKIACLRSAVVPGWEQRARVPLDRLLKFGKVIQQSVSNVTSGVVTLKDGTVLTADYIVLCHGGSPALFPSSPHSNVTDSASVVAALKAAQKKFSTARSILIAGGGPVGVEMAGELRAQYPDKAITLVHSHDSLLSTSNPPINPEAKAKLLALLQSLNITVKLNTRVNSLPRVENNDAIVTGSQQYSLSDGTTIQADLLFLAVGNAAPQGNIVSAVDEHNLVKVDSSFRVEGLRNVFCCGDANNHPETKLAYTGGLQAKHAAHSIERLEKGKQVKPYVGLEAKRFGAMFVPVGPTLGVGSLDTTLMGNYLVSTIKGKGLFSKKTFGELNVPLPPV